MKQISAKIMKGSLFLTLEITAGLLAAAFLIWLALIWRLAQGPIGINFLTEKLEQAISSHSDEYLADFGGTQLVWGGGRSPLEIQVNDVRIARKDSTPVLAISKIGMQFSKPYLLMGQIKPKVLTFFNPAFKIVRRADGQIYFNLNEDAPLPENLADSLSLEEETEAKQTPIPEIQDQLAKKDQEDFLKTMIDVMRQQQDSDSPFSQLRLLAVAGADIVFDDQKMGGIWHVEKASFRLKRNQNGLMIDLNGGLQLGDELANFRLKMFHRLQRNVTEAMVIATDLNPVLLAQNYPYLSFLDGIKMPINGGARLIFDETLSLRGAFAALRSDGGDVYYQKINSTAYPLRNVMMQLQYDGLKQKLDMTELTFDIEEGKVKADGMIQYEAGKQADIAIKGALTNAAVDYIPLYWPEIVAPTARGWVTEHISKGMVQKATLNSKMHFDLTGNAPKFSLDSLTGEIDFTGVTADYLPPMPVATGGAGHARYSLADFEIDIRKGKVPGMVLDKGHVMIDGFEELKEKIAINLKAKGDVQKSLQLMNSKPLSLLENFEFDTKKIKGHADLDLSLAFPLTEGMTLHDVKVEAKAKLSAMTLPNLISNLSLTGGPFDLTANEEALKISGSGQLAGRDTQFDWQRNFKKSAPFLSRAEAYLQLDYPLLKTFSVPEMLGYEGKISSKVTYTEQADHSSVLMLHGDLAKASFDFDAAKLSKKLGEAGSLDMTLKLQNKILKKIEDLKLVLQDGYLSGGLKFKSDAAQDIIFESATLNNYKMGRNDGMVFIQNKGRDQLHFDIKGRQIDFAPFLSTGEKTAEDKKLQPLKKQAVIMITTDVKHALMPKGNALSNVKTYLRTDIWGEIDQFELDAHIGKGDVYLRYVPDASGRHSLTVDAKDAGATLSALGVTEKIIGGRLMINSKARDEGGPRDMSGSLTISDFSVVKTPVLAKLLNALSLSGLQSLLSGKGLEFSKLKSRFIWMEKTLQPGYSAQKILKLKDGRTSGTSLGLSFAGEYDWTQDILDIKGTIVPISGVNKVIGNIPVLGHILTGGGDAVFAATYKVKGTSDQAKVTVNPLAALAPGFLRKLFFEGD